MCFLNRYYTFLHLLTIQPSISLWRVCKYTNMYIVLFNKLIIVLFHIFSSQNNTSWNCFISLFSKFYWNTWYYNRQPCITFHVMHVQLYFRGKFLVESRSICLMIFIYVIILHRNTNMHFNLQFFLSLWLSMILLISILNAFNNFLEICMYNICIYKHIYVCVYIYKHKFLCVYISFTSW